MSALLYSWVSARCGAHSGVASLGVARNAVLSYNADIGDKTLKPVVARYFDFQSCKSQSLLMYLS
jgi:hypothetical protein